MAGETILVIDDEQNILDLISAYLRREGYRVLTAQDGINGLKLAQSSRPDIVILDIMLPGMDGIDVLRELRRTSSTYIIMLSAKSEETDRIVGLTLGADDYVTKPFSPRELVARVKAALRRLSAPPSTITAPAVLEFRRLRIDAGRRQVWKDDLPVELTEIEFDILWTLARHRGLVLTRQQILSHVWGEDYYGEERVVDVHIGKIRRKLEDDPDQPSFIVTVRGVGYRFEDKEREP
jgi:two-component system alkaline phosphatase synthesis response regulator PhoP